MTYQARLAEVRARKEGIGQLPGTMEERFAATIESLKREVGSMSQQCASAGLRTPQDEQKLAQNQFSDTVVMNAGGGMRDEPYRKGVLSSFEQRWNLSPEMIELPPPNDLFTAAGRKLPDGWFRRLTVAYGLSFSQQDLHHITMPDAVLPLPGMTNDDTANTNTHHIQGRCRGCGRPAIPGDDYCYSCSG